MTAELEFGGSLLPVKMRNLSPIGALVQGEELPIVDAQVVFRRGELAVRGRVACVRDGRAGIAFHDELLPEQVLHHRPTPARKPQSDGIYRRPGFVAKPPTVGEQSIGSSWVSRSGSDKVGE